jgi:hypothetical protein
MARKKKEVEVEDLVEPYSFSEVPTEFVIEESSFEPEKMHPYVWTHRGVFYKGKSRMISVRVDGEK